MLAKLGSYASSLGFLISIFESLLEILKFFNEEDNTDEDNEKAKKEAAAELVVKIYTTIVENTEEDLPFKEKTVRKFVESVIDLAAGLIETLGLLG